MTEEIFARLLSQATHHDPQLRPSDLAFRHISGSSRIVIDIRRLAVAQHIWMLLEPEDLPIVAAQGLPWELDETYGNVQYMDARQLLAVMAAMRLGGPK